MAIDGRINVDVLFHDTDGTTSLKVVSLEDSTAYTTGKVAIVTGTCGTAASSISIGNVYKDSTGELVDFATITRVAFRGTPEVRVSSGFAFFGISRNGDVTVANNPINNGVVSLIQVSSTAGTASYTLVLYGT